MAKGNLFLGYGRGKVGSLVFSRRKGEQIVRARNTAPANPRTNSQMAQRMKMYAPVQLYRQSMRAFFKFAFNVASKETIFNAYMRENIAIAPWTERALATAQAPIPFPARMSSGNVAGYVAGGVGLDTVNKMVFEVSASTEGVVAVRTSVSGGENPTLGQISSALLDANPSLRVGDQLTFVLCHTSGLSVSNGDVSYDKVSGFNFVYAKFVLNPQSDRLPSEAGFSYSDGILELGTAGDWVKDAVGGCIIVTRNEGSKVIASNSTLTLNAFAKSVYDTMTTAAYEQKAALSYKATEDAYLNPATTE